MSVDMLLYHGQGSKLCLVLVLLALSELHEWTDSLQAVKNEDEISCAMAEGIQHISDLITYYAIFETTYRRATYNENVGDGLRVSMTGLYKIMLEYLCKAQRYYGDNKIGNSASFNSKFLCQLMCLSWI
jgi:hypothetical protein